MFLVDTSIWINLFRDTSGKTREKFINIVGENPYFLSYFSQMELLQGCRNEQEWTLLNLYLQDQDYLQMNDQLWSQSARIYYDLRRLGLTVRSTLDCCIAQLALNYELILLHNDRDFEVIAQIRPLQNQRFS